MLHLREALIQTGWGDLIGGCEGLLSPANPPKEAIEAPPAAGQPGGERADQCSFTATPGPGRSAPLCPGAAPEADIRPGRAPGR
jgi:hypothetical protein